MVSSKKGGIPDRMNRSLIHDPDAGKPAAMKCRKRVPGGSNWAMTI